MTTPSSSIRLVWRERPLAARRRGQRGAVYIEAIVALPVVALFFLQLWQLVTLFTAHLVLSHAAYAAARAAVVVGPDDSKFYDYDEVDDLESGDDMGLRMEDVTTAAYLAAGASPALAQGDIQVEAIIDGDDSFAPLTATVYGEFACPLPWLSLVCLGDDVIVLQAEATFPYQGALYEYGDEE